MISSLRPTWRDYIAKEELADGKSVVLGAFSAKVGHAFEVACQLWPDVFLTNRGGRIMSDEKPAVVDRAVSRG